MRGLMGNTELYRGSAFGMSIFAEGVIMIDYLKKVKEKKDEQGELEARWQSDEDLLYLKKYIMRDAGGVNAVPDIVNVTLNRPAVFAANAIAALGSTSEQRVVLSEDKNVDTAYIEGFIKAGFAAANNRLRHKVLLNPFSDTQFCIRGRTARRVLFRMENGVLIPDIVPWDGRFVTYDLGEGGLDWAAYEMERSKGAIESEKWAIKMGFTISGKKAKVLDVWDAEHNEVWVDGKKIFEQPHTYGFTPIVVQVVSLGYGGILLSEGHLKNEGESIFFLIREAIPELYRLVSIWQTLNLKSVKPPMKYRSKQGVKAVPPDYEDATDMGTITPVDETGDIVPINYGDAQRSATLAFNMMNAAIDEGTISPADLGAIERPPASGVRALIAGEHINNLLRPRLEAKANLNKQTAEMFTEQVIQIGGRVEIGTRGHKRTFETSKLKGEYDITYKYTFKSPSVDAGLVSLSAAYGHLIPDRAKREEILQREDPDEDERQLDWEDAARLSPAIKMRRIAKSLIEMGEDEEAKLLADEAQVNLEMLLSGDISQQPKPERKEEPKQVLSLFGGATGRVSPEVPEEEEG